MAKSNAAAKKSGKRCVSNILKILGVVIVIRKRMDGKVGLPDCNGMVSRLGRDRMDVAAPRWLGYKDREGFHNFGGEG